MNGTRDTTRLLTGAAVAAAASANAPDVLICPPFPYLSHAVELAADSRVQVGAQNCAAVEDGAYTGEVSARMLADCGLTWCLVGHSERRQLFAESDQLVAEKFVRVHGSGLTPILCVGETLAEREAGLTLEVIARQLAVVVARAGIEKFSRSAVAYEPVWAIGTGRTASCAEAQEVHRFIRSQIQKDDAIISGSVRILYGGSVKASNAAALLQQEDIDGALVGGASLDPQEFAAIVAAAL